ncbi:CRTAC1 family protein [Saprospiraceae bacterium]|nr:CRTAC1 family protein [Saprospiraceae bacterium]
MNIKISIFLIIILGMCSQDGLQGQNIDDLQPVINKIGNLESARDPKCHATASRLEDFIYGTPLSFSARNKRIEFQKNFVKTLWLEYSRSLNNDAAGDKRLALFKKIESKYFVYKESSEGINLRFHNDYEVFLAERDYRQYSSIAYAFRAILSVQQSFLFEAETLASLDDETLDYFKKSLDLAVLVLLNEADKLAREENQYQIEEKHIDLAVKKLFDNLHPRTSSIAQKTDTSINRKALIYNIIKQKLTAYQNYNQISQAVFLRNIQVYFSKIPWPSETSVSNSLKNHFTELMIQFSTELFNQAELSAVTAGKSSIDYQDMYEAVQVYLPHTINSFEDVTYFQNLSNAEQVVIESYDLDAFRDSGLHWQYLKFALDDRKDALKATPDPFALEMMVEGIAQFAVLVFRLGGEDAKNRGQELLSIKNMNNSILSIQEKLKQHENAPVLGAESKIVSVKESSESSKTSFLEVTNELGLRFEHRNSDWLNRLIRSYVVKEDENLARLAIPPAFGGGGVAAEDFDNDGWVDLLLLGGRGNQLLKNKNGEQLVDITHQAGVDYKRSDGKYGEPRQPIIVDFDNDGFQDIFISYANDSHRIYKNKGDGTFEDVTDLANLGGLGLVGGPSTALDFDNDGLLDLYIGYFGNYLKGELPTLKRHNTNGSPNKLFRNKGNFTFEDVSKGSGIENTGWTQAVGHADINQDGWQDLIVGNDFGINSYYINNQDGTFRDESAELGTNKPSYTMNVGIGDLNRDLYPDFYISNIVVMEKDDKYVLPNEDTKAHFDPSSLSTMRVVEANDLFISSTSENQVTYQKSNAVGRGYSSTGWSWDADFFDFDNDGDEDLYCLTGMNPYSVYGKENAYYSSPDGESKAVVYAESSEESNIFFENRNGLLEVNINSGGLDYSSTSRSAAYFDMDNDGDLDIVVNDYQGKARIFKNQAEKGNNHWAKIKLIGDPKANISKDAIGTSLIITLPNGEKIWKEVHSTTGYLSGHPKEFNIGLGTATEFSLIIKWSNGKVQELNNLKANEAYKILYKDK